MSKRNLIDPVLIRPTPSTPAPALLDSAPPAPLEHVLDFTAARAAYERSRVTLAAFAPSDLTQITFTARDAATVAFRVSLRCADPVLRARFESLARDGGFRLSALDQLRDASLATWYVATRLLDLAAAPAKATIPDGSLEELDEVTPRMQRVLSFLFGDDPSLKHVLARHGKARSHRARAEAALCYVGLYREHAETVRASPRHFESSDAARASAAANAMIASLDRIEATELASMRIEQRRAVTWLLGEYAEVAAAGVFLERSDPRGAAEHFPSLISAGRAPPKRRNKADSTSEAKKLPESAKTPKSAKLPKAKKGAKVAPTEATVVPPMTATEPTAAPPTASPAADPS